MDLSLIATTRIGGNMNHVIEDAEVVIPHIICGAGHTYPLMDILCVMCLDQRRQPDPRETNYIQNSRRVK